MLEIPETFKASSRSPQPNELRWLYDWLLENKDKYNDGKKILEFGCGITSWVLNEAIKPERHVAVELYAPCIKMTKKHLPSIEMIKTTWDDIPKIEYDVVFVDSSTAPPKGLKPMAARIVYRDDAIKYAEAFQSKKALVIMHDWNYKGPWRLHRKYVEANGYNLLGSLATRYGLGIYQKQG